MPTWTIGVAIAVPEPFATRLQDARRAYGDPQADLIPTHVTLLPPTEVPRERMPDVRRHLEEVARETVPFHVELRGTDTFRPVSPVVFVPLVRGASACTALATLVRTGPLERGLEFSYHPHVTVGHHLDDDALDAAQEGLRDAHVDFDVDELVLYSRDDAHNWQRVAGFDLLGDVEPPWSPRDGGQEPAGLSVDGSDGRAGRT